MMFLQSQQRRLAMSAVRVCFRQRCFSTRSSSRKVWKWGQLRELGAVASLAFLPSLDVPELEDINPGRPVRQRPVAQVDLIGERVTLRELNLRYQVVPGKKATHPVQLGFGDKKKLLQFEIGTGAYGTVLKGMDRTGRFVAIKVIEENAMEWEHLKDEVEALQLARKHPNVNELLEVLYCQETGCYYVVTEYCAGGELFDRLIDEGPYKEQQAARLVERIASSLQHIHQSGYAHHDLKPENLLFTVPKSASTAEEMDLRLIDFGMTKSLRSYLENGFSTITSSIGTTPYLSPEILVKLEQTGRTREEKQSSSRSRQSVPAKVDIVVTSDPRACDMWALGIIAYILVIGCHPFDRTGDAPDRIIAKRAMRGSLHDSGDGDIPAAERRFTFDVHKQLQLSPEAQDLISKLLDPDPVTRLTSEQVLAHPWIRKNLRRNENKTKISEASTAELESLKRASLNRFQSSSGSHRAIATALLVASLAKKGKDTSPDMFLADGYNVLSSAEWRTVFKTMGNVSELDLASSAQGLSFEEFRGAVQKYHSVNFDQGQVVFCDGDEASGLYVLLSGRAQIEYAGKDGAFRVVADLGPGDLFGETAILDGRDKRNATVRCTTPAQALFLSREEFVKTFAGGSSSLCVGLEEYIRGRQNARARNLLFSLGGSKLQKRKFGPGENLFQEHDASDWLYVIQSGVVQTSVPSVPLEETRSKPNGVASFLSKLFSLPTSGSSEGSPVSEKQSDDGIEPSQIVGPAMVPLRRFKSGDILGTNTVTGAPRIATATCETEVEVLAVSKRDLDDLISLESSLHRNLLRLARRDVEERTAQLRKVPKDRRLLQSESKNLGPVEVSALIKSIQKQIQKSSVAK